ncbi:hypothetical protein [Stenotrophomonas sp. NPDC078853]|uniref:hypothetical protein n=1 Tax=Stenotrophomonas sp. NPDC078853 TaxID=3364534 RepID=UPI00384CC074
MVNDMNANERLRSLQASLGDRGVVDVKFFFSKDGATPTKVVSDVVNVLDAMLNGRTLPFNGVGDSVRGA